MNEISKIRRCSEVRHREVRTRRLPPHKRRFLSPLRVRRILSKTTIFLVKRPLWKTTRCDRGSSSSSSSKFRFLQERPKHFVQQIRDFEEPRKPQKSPFEARSSLLQLPLFLQRFLNSAVSAKRAATQRRQKSALRRSTNSTVVS